MDLKQPLSFPSMKSAQKATYPTKTTINMMRAQGNRFSRGTQVALFVVLLVLVGLFAKFAVIDPLAGSMGSSAQVAAAEEQLAQLKNENAHYAEVNEEYSRYVVTGLTEDERNLTDRVTVLNLLESKVMGVGFPSSIKVVGNAATVTSLGVNLDEVARLVEDLKNDDRVAYVTVSTAQGETDASTSATIQISFKGALDASEDATSGASAVAAAGTTRNSMASLSSGVTGRGSGNGAA